MVNLHFGNVKDVNVDNF